MAGTSSGGSFMTSLLIMLGLTGLALAVMLATEGRGVGMARSLVGAPSALRSRRLSTSRISLRNPPEDGDGSGTIAYRE